MHHPRIKAELYLDGRKAGLVSLRGSDSSWSYGHFQPTEAFAPFAPLFGRWSLLMHADGAGEKLSEAASDELRNAEYEIDRLDAQMFWTARREWMKITQLNIDGSLIEWKTR